MEKSTSHYDSRTAQILDGRRVRNSQVHIPEPSGRRISHFLALSHTCLYFSLRTNGEICPIHIYPIPVTFTILCLTCLDILKMSKHSLAQCNSAVKTENLFFSNSFSSEITAGHQYLSLFELGATG